GVDHRVEQGGLVGEDPEDRALGDPRRGGDLPGRDGGALLQEQGQRGGHDGGPPFLAGQRGRPSPSLYLSGHGVNIALSESSLSHEFAGCGSRRRWETFAGCSTPLRWARTTTGSSTRWPACSAVGCCTAGSRRNRWAGTAA